jgi:hypothetical protein
MPNHSARIARLPPISDQHLCVIVIANVSHAILEDEVFIFGPYY